MSNIKYKMSNLNQLAWRNLMEHRTRTTLSVLAIALGVATIIASSMTSQAIINAIAGSDALSYMQGIIDQLGDTMQMVGVGIGLVAGFMIFNAFLMSVTQRRQQIGALRSLGMTRGQVMRLVLAEALAMALIGTGVGVVAGPLMGLGVIEGARGALSGLFIFEPSSPTASSVVIAIGIGIGLTLLAVAIPARQAAHTSPLEALRGGHPSAKGRSAYRPAMLWVGILMLVGLAVFVPLALPGEWVQPPEDVLLVSVCLVLMAGGLALVLPGLVDGLARAARRPLMRLLGASGRLAADNLSRERGRALRTISALAVSLAMIVGLSGFISFAASELLLPSIERVARAGVWMVLPFDLTQGMGAYSGLDNIAIPPEAIDEISRAVGERGIVMESRFIIVPELAFFGDSYFTFLIDPHVLEQSGPAMFSFTEGDWDTAMPLMETGCGALVASAIASRNGAGLGNTITVTGANGPVECTIAGIGSPMANASILSLAALEDFGAPDPVGVSVWPGNTADAQALRADVEVAISGYPALQITEVENLYELQVEMFDTIPLLFNALLLLAVVAAALGVVNTTLISVGERKRELGLLRAVGATRRQVVTVVVGEAALMGLAGGVIGLAAGVGFTLMVVLVYGGNAWGAPDLDLWGAAWRSAQPALASGAAGLVIAPMVSALAAYFPARAALRGSAIEMLRAAGI